MELQEAISKQRAVKQFLAKKVENEKIDIIVRAGNDCAVAVKVNIHITVITKESVLDFIEEKARGLWLKSEVETFRKLAADGRNSPTCNAPALIMLSAPDSDSSMLQRLAASNCACAAQNMLLTATELGLGSCLLNPLLQPFQQLPEVKQRAEIPVEDRCYDVILLGYTNIMGEKPPKPFANNVHYCS